MEKLLLFQVRDSMYGVNLPLVKGIFKTDAIEFKTEAHPHTDQIRKMVFIDGEELPLYDLSLLFTKDSHAKADADKPYAGAEKVMLVNPEGYRMALKADRTAHVITVPEDRIEFLPPVMGRRSRTCFPRVLRHEEELILLLDPEGLTKDSEISEPSDRRGEPEISAEQSPAEAISEPEKIFPSEELRSIGEMICKRIRKMKTHEELEPLLTEMVQEDHIFRIISKSLAKFAERTVYQEIRRVKQTLSESED